MITQEIMTYPKIEQKQVISVNKKKNTEFIYMPYTGCVKVSKTNHKSNAITLHLNLINANS